MLNFFNFLLHFTHLVLIAFNLLGWIWPKTRRLHLISVLVVFASWFGLGSWYGWGYCPITDWQWQVRRELGFRDMPASYIEWLLEKVTPFDFAAQTVDMLTLSLFLAAFALSLYFNFWNKK